MFMSNHLIGFGAGGDDTVDAFTVLLLHMDGANASTTFTDSSASAHAVTANGNAQISTAQSKFGGASGLFDGTGDTLSLTDHADYAFGTGAFTIDFWLRMTGAAGMDVLINYDIGASGANYTAIYVDGSRLLHFKIVSASAVAVDVVSAAAMSTGAWHHYAIVRNGNVFTQYIDGVADGTATNSLSIKDYTEGPRIGEAFIVSAFNGHLDEFRISKGVARWTANFTPPTSPY